MKTISNDDYENILRVLFDYTKTPGKDRAEINRKRRASLLLRKLTRLPKTRSA